MKFPVHRLPAVLKFHPVSVQEFLQMIFAAAEIAKVGGVPQREFQRLNRVIKTHEADVAGNFPRSAQNGKRIGRSAQTDIPDHEFARMIMQPLAQPELIDIKRLRLRNRSDDRMKRLVIRERTHGTDSVVQADELVIAGHKELINHETRETHEKTFSTVAALFERRWNAGIPEKSRRSQTAATIKEKPAIRPNGLPANQTSTKIRVAPSPCRARRKAGPSWPRFRRPCWRCGTSCPDRKSTRLNSS